jgi:hypothetical protein
MSTSSLDQLDTSPITATRAAPKGAAPLRLKLQTTGMAIGFVVILVTALGAFASKLGDAVPQGTLNTNHSTSYFEITNNSSETVPSVILDDPQSVQAAADAKAINLRLVCEKTQLSPGEKTRCGPGNVSTDQTTVSITDLAHRYSPKQWATIGLAGLGAAMLLLFGSLLPVFAPRRVALHSVRGVDGKRTWSAH